MKQTKKSLLLLTILLISLMSCLLVFPVYATTETLYPNAVGDSSQCTPSGVANNWDCCDETPSDDDTTYVVSSDFDANAYLDLYNLVDTAIPAGSTINSVTVKVNIRSILTAAKAGFRIALKKSGGTTQYGSSISPTTSYTVYSQVFAGVALSDLNALQAGIEIKSKYYGVYDSYLHGRCTQVWVEIDYTIAQQGTSLNLTSVITATFSVLSQKTIAFSRESSITETFSIQGLKTVEFAKYPSITATFNFQHLKAINFLKDPTVTLTIGINGLLSYWTPSSLNLFGIIPFVFNIESLKTVDFLRESIITLSTVIDGLMSYTTGGTILNLFGIIPVTFTSNSIFQIPSSAFRKPFWHILAMFSIVMLMVSGVFLIEKQQKKKSQRDDGNNS